MTSHFRQAEQPEIAKQIAWVEGLRQPHTAVLGEIYNFLEAALLARAGQPAPEQGIVQRLAASALAPEESAPPARRPDKRKKTPEEIRAQLGLVKPDKH